MAVVIHMMDVVVADDAFVAVINLLMDNEDWMEASNALLFISKASTNGVDVCSTLNNRDPKYQRRSSAPQ